MLARLQVVVCTLLVALLSNAVAHAQSTIPHDTLKVAPHLSFSGYVDAYYAFYTDSLPTDAYQKFPSVSSRSNQFGLNTAQLTGEYNAEKTRAIITLHFGDIQRSTWSSTFPYLMEAHAGVRLCKKLWVDAGFFRTHFGTEGLLPRENFASLVSINTYYEPYFESGMRINYNPNDKLSINLFVLNGYNMFEDNNDKKSIGMLATYALGDNGNIGYSNYIGDDSPKGDSISRLRIHQNIFVNYTINKLKLQIGGDYCMQQHSDIATSKKTAAMYSGVAAVKFQALKKFAAYGRYEWFSDPQGFMSGVIVDKTSVVTGLKLWGATLGIEYKPTDNSYIRLEGRQLQMERDQEIFWWNGAARNKRMDAQADVGISF